MSDSEWPELVTASQEIWEHNAAFWDDYMGDESNDFHNLLIRPATEKLLDVSPGDRVLDIACGNGNFSRRLADLGAAVTALDFSATMVARARARTGACADRISYLVADATDATQMEAFGVRAFDAAVSNMALMDMGSIGPLLESLGRVIVPGGRFVFSVGHPCFQSPGAAKVVEEHERDGDVAVRRGIKVTTYITPTAHRGLGVVGQPEPHFYFHRPLSVLLGECFRAGFVLDGLAEPVFDGEGDSSRALSWSSFREIPPVLVARLVLLPR